MVGIGTQAYFSDAKTSSINTFTAGVWQYTITATAGDGGSIEPSGNVIVNEGKNQTFTITPDEGYVIADVKVNGKSVIDDLDIGDDGIATHTFFDVIQDHTVHAIFATIAWDKSSLSFTWAGVTDDAWICATVKNGDDSGEMQEKVGWELHYVKSGQAPGLQNDKIENIIAGGKIPALDQGSAYNICWSMETGQIEPGIYKFKAYQRPNHPGVGIFWSHEIVVDETNEKIIYEKATCTITATSGENGKISPYGEIIIEDGTDKTFTITPAEGYIIVDVVVNGESITDNISIDDNGIGTYTLINVSQDYSISANFILKPEDSDVLNDGNLDEENVNKNEENGEEI